MSTQLVEMIASGAGPRVTWMAGDFGRIATYTETEAKSFIARLGIPEGAHVLDVACGTGNLALAAARGGASVRGLDIAPNLLEQARARAQGEELKIQFDEGDAEELPYRDASFDFVVSMYGAMFAQRPDRAAVELMRVCRPGGVIAMANWTPTGFIGHLLRLIAAHVPRQTGAASPDSWGDREVVRDRFRAGVSDLRLTRRTHHLKFPFGVAGTVEFFRLYYGPVCRAFEKLDEHEQEGLRLDLERLWSEHNRACEAAATHVEAEYLEVRARRA